MDNRGLSPISSTLKMHKIKSLRLFLLFLFLGMFYGCASANPNRGDTLAAQLRLGMTKDQVIQALGIDRTVNMFRLPNDLYLFLGEVVPHDLPSSIPEGTEGWTYGYWVNSNTQNNLEVFFSKDERVIGWAKQHSDLSEQKYLHERLTSQLKEGMSEEKVRKLFGPPSRIITLPNQRSREIYSDHFWFRDPVVSGLKDWPMWVYSYPLPNGKVRNVYLSFNNQKELHRWGYDNAHEEAERYLSEQATKK